MCCPDTIDYISNVLRGLTVIKTRPSKSELPHAGARKGTRPPARPRTRGGQKNGRRHATREEQCHAVCGCTRSPAGLSESLSQNGTTTSNQSQDSSRTTLNQSGTGAAWDWHGWRNGGAGTLFVMRNWKHPGQDLSRSFITDLFGAPLAPLVRSRQQTSTPHACRTAPTASTTSQHMR